MSLSSLNSTKVGTIQLANYPFPNSPYNPQPQENTLPSLAKATVW